MKIVILGDLHFGVKNASEVMMRHQKKFFDQLFHYMEQHEIKTIFQLGDQLDNRRNCNLKTIDFAYNSFFDIIDEQSIEYHTLIGNHDVFYKETLDITSSDLLFRNYKNVHVHTEPITLTFDKITFDFIPWICEQNAERCYKMINDSNSDYCLGHFAINEFPVVGTTLFEGGIDRHMFDHYKQVFSGHFHSRSHKDNISYIGTPYQLTWSDAFGENGFVVFDTKTLTWEYVANNDRYYSWLVYDDSAPGQTTTFKENDIEDAFVKVVVKCKNKPFLYNNYLNKVFAGKPADVKIVDQILLDLQNGDIDQSISVKNTVELINDYISGLDVTNKDDLIRYMTSLYNEAVQMQEEVNADS